MKRLFYILLLFSSLLPLFAGCGKDASPEGLCRLVYPITGMITVTKKNSEVKADLLLEKEQMVLTLQGQNEGTSFILTEDEASLKAGELTLQIEKNRLPEEGFLFEALTLPEDAPLLKSTASLEGRACTVFTYVTTEVNFRYYFEGRRLLRIVIEKEEPITVDFS
ncbi:MAG: hypothetical protein IJZ33_01050 [Clostridia bacterium]|nr:hypothetical protein [Clostridia bacterium]